MRGCRIQCDSPLLMHTAAQRNCCLTATGGRRGD